VLLVDDVDALKAKYARSQLTRYFPEAAKIRSEFKLLLVVEESGVLRYNIQSATGQVRGDERLRSPHPISAALPPLAKVTISFSQSFQGLCPEALCS